MVRETVTLEGHLIDSDILRRVFDRVVEEGGEFEVQEFRVGRTNDEPSFARIAVRARDPHALDRILEALRYLGATSEVGGLPLRARRARRHPARRVLLHHQLRHVVRIDGRWVEAADQKMDSRAGAARRRAALREAAAR